MVESSNNTWCTVEGKGKSFQYFCSENPLNSMERQKYIALKDELPMLVDDNMLLENIGEETPEMMKGWNHSKNIAQLWVWLVMEVKADAVKNNIT